MMKRYVYIGICIVLLAALTACHKNENAQTPDFAEVTDSEASPDSDSATPPDSPEDSDSVAVPDSPEGSDTVTAPDSSEDSNSVAVPYSPETSDTMTAPDSDTVAAPDSDDTTEFVAAPLKEARDLTPDELQTWSKFLCRSDCNGFLMSSFDTPLQADLVFVFYTGAGVGEFPTQEMVDDYLKANDLEEAYTDITFIPYDKASAVLERRTGYTLEHFKLAGNDIPMYYSQKYKGYFHMAGDTNYMPVECVSGRENPDGSLSLEVRESSDWSGEAACSFETTLKPDSTGRNMLFDKNLVTGGWLTWETSNG